jgi:hypothetical protein
MSTCPLLPSCQSIFKATKPGLPIECSPVRHSWFEEGSKKFTSPVTNNPAVKSKLKPKDTGERSTTNFPSPSSIADDPEFSDKELELDFDPDAINCKQCQAPLSYDGKGRKPVYCSEKCRQRFARGRAT